jgi:hypothetical protein
MDTEPWPSGGKFASRCPSGRKLVSRHPGSLQVDVLLAGSSQVDTCATMAHDKHDIPVRSDLVRSHAGLARSRMPQLAPV